MKLLDGTGSKDNDIISQYLFLLILIKKHIYRCYEQPGKILDVKSLIKVNV